MYGLLIFALIKPDSLSYLGFSQLENGLVALDVLLLFFLCMQLLLGTFKVSRVTVAIAAYFLVLGVTTLANEGDVLLFVKMAGPGVAACLLIDYAISNHLFAFLTGATASLAILYSANLLTIFIYYPTGMYNTEWVAGDTYLMGFDNGMIYNLLPLGCFAVLLARVKSGKIVDAGALVCLGIGLVSVYYVQAASGMLQLTLFAFLLLFARRGWLRPPLRAALITIWLATSTLAVLLGKISIPQQILDLFGKDATLTGRTDLWGYVITVWEQSPLTGTALGTPVVGANGHLYPHPHSLVADTLFTSGILGFFALLGVFWVLIQKFSTTQDDSIATAIIFAAVLSLLVGETANSPHFKALFWAVLALSAHGSKIEAISAQPISVGRNLNA